MASNISTMAPDVSLTRYMQEIRKFPMLAHEEEERLARAWRDEGKRYTFSRGTLCSPLTGRA